MNKLKNNSGIALILSLMIMMFLVTFGSILLLRVFTQKNLVDRSNKLTTSYYLAEAGANAGLHRLNRLINAYLLNTLHTANPSEIPTKINNAITFNKGIEFLIDFTKDSGVPQFTENNGFAIHQGTLVVLPQGQYEYQIRVWQKGSPSVIAAEIWDFPFYFTVQSTGLAGDITQKISASGDFTIRAQRINFAKSILFNNANFNIQNEENSFVASSNDISNKITWQEGQP